MAGQARDSLMLMNTQCEPPAGCAGGWWNRDQTGKEGGGGTLRTEGKTLTLQNQVTETMCRNSKIQGFHWCQRCLSWNKMLVWLTHTKLPENRLEHEGQILRSASSPCGETTSLLRCRWFLGSQLKLQHLFLN